LDPTVLQVLQVRRVHLELLVLLVLLETMETSEWLVWPEHLVQQVEQDQLVLTDLPVHLVLPEPQGRLEVRGALASKGPLELWDHLDPPVVQASADFKDHLGRLVLQVLSATPETLGLPDPQVLLGHKDLPE